MCTMPCACAPCHREAVAQDRDQDAEVEGFGLDEPDTTSPQQGGGRQTAERVSLVHPAILLTVPLAHDGGGWRVAPQLTELARLELLLRKLELSSHALELAGRAGGGGAVERRVARGIVTLKLLAATARRVEQRCIGEVLRGVRGGGPPRISFPSE